MNSVGAQYFKCDHTASNQGKNNNWIVFISLKICIHEWTLIVRTIDLSDCHTLPDSAINGRVTDRKIICPFAFLRMRFLSVPREVNAPRVKWYPFYPVITLAGFEHFQNFERMLPDKDVR